MLAGRMVDLSENWFKGLLAKSWEKRLVLSLICILLGVIGGFFEFASEVREKETEKFDQAVMVAIHESEIGSSPRVGEIARDLTALGGVTVLTIVTLVAFGTAVFSGRSKLGWLGVSGVLVGSLATSLLKHSYNRPRPDLFEHGSWVYNASFPSGHSMMSAVVYLTLGILVARIQQRRSVRWFIISIAILITLLVGLSRIYLGVHWPTDVVGGWMLGGAWAAFIWLIAIKVDPTRREK